MPKTLLVPLDGTEGAERALPVAARFGERLDADIVLVGAQLDGESPIEWLDAAKAKVGVRGVHTEIVLSASVADGLSAVADDTNEPVICMATHARGALGRVLFGSVAEEVVRRLDIPALLVGPACRPVPRLDGPLIVCFDGSATSAAVVPAARDWARALSTRVVLVHVFHPLDVETAVAPEEVVGAVAAELASEIDVDVQVVRGYSPALTIAGLVDELDPVLVALATHGRTGMPRAALGSVAIAIVRDSPCPALVVRPAPAEFPSDRP
jgi:nucleotide-binding universal stress UspA family protein